MTKDSSSLRKCSHCGHNGHNSRTCNNVKGCGFKLFGVRIDPNPIQIQNNLHGEEDHCYSQSQSAIYGIGGESIRKTKSMGNLQACSSSNVGINIGNNEHNLVDHGYLSDGLLDQSKETHDRKKGVPWTEYEHRSFLIGLKKLGKGDWRGISKNYVPSRTPTQVASHAQKYFIRMNATEKRKRRSSLFDMPLKESDSSPTSSVLPSNEAPDVSLQLGTAPVAPLKNTTDNIKGQATTSAAPVTTSERPPLSPVARTYGVQDFQCMPYMVGYPSNKLQKFGNSKCMPTVSFVPVVNYPSQSCVYPLYGHGNGNFTFHSPFVSQSSTSLLSQPLPMPVPHESSQAGLASAVPKKEGLEASIGALSL